MFSFQKIMIKTVNVINIFTARRCASKYNDTVRKTRARQVTIGKPHKKYTNPANLVRNFCMQKLTATEATEAHFLAQKSS